MSLHEEPTPAHGYDEVVAEQHIAEAESTISPKVAAVAAVNIILVVVVAVLGAVTPDMLVALGPWAPLIFVAVNALATTLAGYIKRDPLREV